jgi:rare lipoprotein A
MMMRLWPIPSSARVSGMTVIVCLALAACGGPRRTEVGGPPGIVPGQGIYKVGKPYQVDGVWYYPSEDPDYDEKGIASWYGPNFHEKYTANGEIFDQNGLSAAHRTLPMPSIVEVTNLENGRTIRVRVNDRGPFVGDRIIDMSRRSAQLLGFEREGTAKVEVRYILADSLQAQALARANNPDQGPFETPQAAPEGPVVAQALTSTGPAPPPPAPLPAPIIVASAEPSALPPPPAMPSYARIPAEEAPTPVPTPAHVMVAPPQPALPQTVTYAPVEPSHIYIQAGAFSQGDNAQRMKAKLDGLGQVTVIGISVNGLNLYRVRLGPIASVDEADRLLEKVKEAGATEARIVVN